MHTTPSYPTLSPYPIATPSYPTPLTPPSHPTPSHYRLISLPSPPQAALAPASHAEGDDDHDEEGLPKKKGQS